MERQKGANAEKLDKESEGEGGQNISINHKSLQYNRNYFITLILHRKNCLHKEGTKQANKVF